MSELSNGLGDIRIVFMGTPDFAVPSLRVLLEEGCQVVGVVTQPDRPKGRKRVLTPPPVKVEAELHGIPVYQPERMRSPEAVERVAAFAPDLIVTAAFGQLLPKAVLELPRYGCINVHGSLLPKYRGGAPIQHAIMNGETVTGVTILYMAEGLDTGDMIAKVEVAIEEQDNAGTMFEKLREAGAELLRRTLPGLLAGACEAVPQDHAEATVSPNIRREDERISWSRPARELVNQIRGLCPWPVAFTTWNGEPFKVWEARLASEGDPGFQEVDSAEHTPGEVLFLSDLGIMVQTGAGAILLTSVQPAGKKAMSAADFRRGGTMKSGMVLGAATEE